MALLSVRDVVVRFGGVVAVNDASIEVDPGLVTGLIGPNGAGKTTLFNVVTGLQPPTEGRVLFADKDVTSMPPHRRARLGMARTFQRLEAFGSLTVWENVLIAAELYKRWGGGDASPVEVANHLVDRVGLRERVDQQADSVPTGIARLLEVARALATNPKLLLLDEPSSGLNENETESFGELLRDLASEGRAVLMVEHDMSLVMSVCDYIHVLDFGSIIAAGTPQEVQHDPKVQEAYLGALPEEAA